jgi:peptide/nickel transport system substrate-binding protein
MERNLLDIYKIKKRKATVLYYIVALFLSVVLLAGCFYGYIPEPADFAAAQTNEQDDMIEKETPQSGGELRVPISVPDTLNPLFAGTKGLSDFFGIVFEGLFEFGDDLKPIPVLAQSWETKEQGRVWHIKIRDGVRFHDGYELTAEDVVFTFKALQGGLLGSPYENGIFGNPDIETMVVDEDDPYAIYVYLFEPINNMLELLTFPILPRHVYQTDVFMIENKGNLSILPVGTGPFKADSTDWDPAVSLRLIRNDDWWGDKPLFDSICGIIFEDEALARSAFMRGETDIFNSGDMFANVQVIGRNVQKHSYLTSDFEFIGFNHEHPFLSEVSVRRAIAYALDRRQIISVVYNDGAQDTEAPILPTSWLYRSGHGVFETDFDRASDLLEEAGFTGIDENGIRFRAVEAGSEQLKVRLLTNLESGLRRHAQELIARQLKAAGISVEIHILPWDQFVAALREKDFDMVLTGFDVGRFPDLNFNIHLGADELPFSLYSSDELNNILDEAERVYDQEALRSIYGNVQGYINNMLPVISLYFRTASVFFDERVKGVETPLTEDIYNGIEKWHFVRLDR